MVPSFMRKLILAAAGCAIVAAAVSGLAAVAQALHARGVSAPYSWEEVMFGSK